MSKKDKKQEIVMTPDNEIKVEDEPMFEAEAYTAPQPEAGSDVTVMKTVGTGGPVPIVAPKHNTIQLQPIVVPLAVVPYMTQDSNVLRTDGRGQNGYAQATVENDKATDFETIAARKIRKRGKIQPRIFALVTFILSALVVLPFILSYFVPSVGTVSIEKFNIIGTIKNWVANGFELHPLSNLAYIGVAAVSAVMTIASLVSVIGGKYPRALNFIFSLVAAGAMLAVMIKWIIDKSFVASEQVGFLVILVLALVNLVLSIVFAVLLNKLDDKVENAENLSREI
ncbi:MAG TPA: hypothetical protein DEF02_04685 [Clostridiales bacterium]|nr:hypothetical protein [Clostridiales bacterium]HBP51979.1 hypothetical protein [Clostridiales bacterium]HBW05849.1 hypothetical protein [Clostridiales bacterium]HCH93193.1 hypothetical protein [Clostridiales bacterium]